MVFQACDRGARISMEKIRWARDLLCWFVYHGLSVLVPSATCLSQKYVAPEVILRFRPVSCATLCVCSVLPEIWSTFVIVSHGDFDVRPCLTVSFCLQSSTISLFFLPQFTSFSGKSSWDEIGGASTS